MRVLLRILSVGILVLVTGCQKAPQTQPITIFAAASTIDAMDEIIEAFKLSSGQDDLRIRTNYSASSTLAMLMLQGVHADIFLPAHPECAEQVQAIYPESERFDLLTNRLIVVTNDEFGDWVIEQGMQEIPKLAGRIAIGDPDYVPAGKYARDRLVAGGVWGRVKPNMVLAADVRQALAMVTQGVVNSAIVYESDVNGSDDLHIVYRFEDSVSSPILYPLVLINRATENPAVDELAQFLCGEEAAKIFIKHGFTPLNSIMSEGDSR